VNSRLRFARAHFEPRIAAVRFSPVRRDAPLPEPRASSMADNAMGMGRSLHDMTTERSKDARIYTMIAGTLLVCLLTFGILSTLGVFR